MKTIKLFILYLLPKNFLSYFVGFVASLRLPQFLLRPLIKGFCHAYKVNIDEAKLNRFSSFNDFFTRELKPESRPIDKDQKSVVSPVDGIIGYGGKIEEDTLIQAKGRNYSLQAFVANNDYTEMFQNGSYLTIYLSPSHYHRIHSPISGEIKSLNYIPGKLYPVNPFAINNINHIFSKNERLITIIKSSQAGYVGVVKVGATNVGKIKVVYDTITSNNLWRTPTFKEYQNINTEKGMELGRFELGSTVVLLFQEQIQLSNSNIGSNIKLGEKIGYIR